MRTIRSMSVAVLVAAATAASGQVKHQLRLWGVDADDGQLFAIDDVSRPRGSFRDFGVVRTPDGVRIEDGTAGDGVEIGGFTVIQNRYGYLAVNDTDSGESRLYTIDLRGLTPGMPAVVKEVGLIDLAGLDGTPGGDAGGWVVTGIAAGTLTDEIYALASDGDPATADRLYTINDLFGRGLFTTPVGPIAFGDDAVRSGGDISIGPRGNVLITDDAGGRVVAVDPREGSIVSVRRVTASADSPTLAGGLAWDALNDRTAMFDASARTLTVTGAGGTAKSYSLARVGIVDAEGLSFVLEQEEVSEDAAGGGGAFSNMPPAFRPRDPALSRGGRARAGGGGGGGGGAPESVDGLFNDLLDDPLDEPYEPGDEIAFGDPIEPDTGGGGPGPGPGGGEEDEPGGGGGGDNPFTVTVPAPATGVILIGSAMAAMRRRRVRAG